MFNHIYIYIYLKSSGLKLGVDGLGPTDLCSGFVVYLFFTIKDLKSFTYFSTQISMCGFLEALPFHLPLHFTNQKASLHQYLLVCVMKTELTNLIVIM